MYPILGESSGEMTGSSLGLHLKSINVPNHRVIGNSARLTCKFDMGSDTLYSVKWYKDDQEFYRYVPNDRPKLQVFKTDGITVDKSRSTRQHVGLTNLTLESGGTYKCEVSAEAPSFKTVSAFQDMVVVVLPTKSEILGAAPKYAVGDIVNVTCFSYRSKPAASLTWKVNNEEVSTNYESFANFGGGFIDNLRHKSGKGSRGHSENRKIYPLLNAELREYKPEKDDGSDGTLETSSLGLSFRVRPGHVTSGLKLECTTSIGSVHWQSIQEKIPVKQKTSQSQVSSKGNSWWTTVTGLASPNSAIYGAKANFGRLLILSYLLPAVVLLSCAFCQNLLLLDEGIVTF